MTKTNDGYLKAIDFYLKQGIINISDVMSLGEEALMKKILEQVSSEQIYKLGDYWAVRIYDPTKPDKRRRIKRKNRRDLEKILLELHAAQAHQVTFASIYKEFMSYKSRLQAETTIKEYVKSYNKYYRDDDILNVDLRTLTVPDLEKWLRSKIEDAGGMNEKQYQKLAVVFSELLKYAFQQHYIDENPFERITRKRLSVTKFQRKPSTAEVFNTEEIPFLMEAIREDYTRKPDPVPLAVKLAFQTGLRVGELVALKWVDVDFDGRLLTVQRFERQIQKPADDYDGLGHCEYIIVEGTKGGAGARYVELTDSAIETLEELKNYYNRKNFESEWIFDRPSGKIHYRALDLRIGKYCRETGIPHRSIHSIRKTFISALRDGGMSFEKIAEIVGHKQISTTMAAYSYDLKADEQNVKMMNNALNFTERDPKQGPKQERKRRPEWGTQTGTRGIKPEHETGKKH